MTATTFNPLATRHSRESGNRDLEAAGIERRQAEAIAEGMREAADAAAGADRGDFATKADLAELETRLISSLATKAELATLRSELRWMLSFLAALILAMAAKLFGIV